MSTAEVHGTAGHAHTGVVDHDNINPGIGRLVNPIEMIKVAKAQFGDLKLLDLDGFGVRSLSSWHGEYLIAAGHYDRDPEGFFTLEQRDEIMLPSDDGTHVVDGMECKRQEDRAQKQFHGVWMRL